MTKTSEMFLIDKTFDPDETYSIEIPKQDQQLPGLLMFLSEINPDAVKLSRP